MCRTFSFSVRSWPAWGPGGARRLSVGHSFESAASDFGHSSQEVWCVSQPDDVRGTNRGLVQNNTLVWTVSRSVLFVSKKIIGFTPPRIDFLTLMGGAPGGKASPWWAELSREAPMPDRGGQQPLTTGSGHPRTQLRREVHRQGAADRV